MISNFSFSLINCASPSVRVLHKFISCCLFVVVAFSTGYSQPKTEFQGYFFGDAAYFNSDLDDIGGRLIVLLGRDGDSLAVLQFRHQQLLWMIRYHLHNLVHPLTFQI